MSCVKQLTHVRVHIALMPTERAVHRSIVGNRRSWFPTVSRRLQRPDQVRENTMLRTFLIGAVSALTLTAAAADETVKFSSILHATFLESQEVGDVDDHAMSLTRYSGLTRFSDGTTGLCYLVATTDYIKGAGTFLVYNKITLSDGSVLLYKAFGTTTMDGTTSRFEGTVAVLGGKGKYEGAKGDGTLTGARPVPLAVGADLYNDLVISIKK